jgi:hypothetical protein
MGISFGPSGGITRAELREELLSYAAKDDLQRLEQKVDAGFRQISGELDVLDGKIETILDILKNGHKPQGT